MVQHVIGDQPVEAGGWKRQVLGVGVQVAEARLRLEVFATLLKHANGKVAQVEAGVFRDAVEVAAPQAGGAAAHLQDLHARFELHLVEDPQLPVVGVGAEVAVQGDAGFQVVGIPILLVFE